MNNWLRIGQILQSYCYLCGQKKNAELTLCHGCCHDLPRISHACQQCGLPISANNQHRHCGQCLKTSPPYERTLSGYIYSDPLKQLISRMKFSGNLALARLLGQLLRDELMDKMDSCPDAILPVPLHERRIKQRGFNQSIELARPIARQLAIPIFLNAVERQIDTPSQTGLSKKQRRANLKHAFNVIEDLPYQHVVILDDVITTGQTVTALAACLRTAGVKRVDCWSVARALPAAAK